MIIAGIPSLFYHCAYGSGSSRIRRRMRFAQKDESTVIRAELQSSNGQELPIEVIKSFGGVARPATPLGGVNHNI